MLSISLTWIAIHKFQIAGRKNCFRVRLKSSGKIHLFKWAWIQFLIAFPQTLVGFVKIAGIKTALELQGALLIFNYTQFINITALHILKGIHQYHNMMSKMEKSSLFSSTAHPLHYWLSLHQIFSTYVNLLFRVTLLGIGGRKYSYE